MSCLQPILVPVKGTPDIAVSIDPKHPEELVVFLGMAMIERVRRLRDHIVFKMLLARLYNARVSGRSLTKNFGVARGTLRRWGRALKSGDMERIGKAFSGPGAQRKVTPEIDRYVRDRFEELYGSCPTYSQVIQGELKKYFNLPVSAERLRWIFKEERQKLASAVDVGTGEVSVDGLPSAAEGQEPALEETPVGAPSCEETTQDEAQKPFLPAPPNYSLPVEGLVYSGRPVGEKPILCHHVGVLLLSPWMDQLTSGWSGYPDLIRQWVGQVLLGAVNHEQSKRLSFCSLEWLIGPMIRSLNHQRHLLGEVADSERTREMLARNGRLLQIAEKELFYFDPHAEEYTGVLKTLKGWSGGLHRVHKIINMDFIHTQEGEPCFVRHADNFYDTRERFFLCRAAFSNLMGPGKRALRWVADRGLYGLDTFRSIVDECKDHFITWEKNYKKDGWEETAQEQSFEYLRARNNSEDLHRYVFRWQEHRWPRQPRFHRLIVRALNPSGRQIEVAILTSDSSEDRRILILALFRRWLQENDFGYMNRHLGINELTSRSHETYGSIRSELNDRQVQSRAYKKLKREKIRAESTLSRLLLKREKQRKAHTQQRQTEEAERMEIEHQIQQQAPHADEVQGEREENKRLKALERLVAKHTKRDTHRKEKDDQLDPLIEAEPREAEEAEKRMAQSVRDESRLEALIEERYLRMDTRRKAFMDAIRLSCRNIFYKLAMEFRPLYDNYRDDHLIVRELTRSSALIEKREGILTPTMEFQPATRNIVEEFLANMSERINAHFAKRYLPVRMRLLSEKSSVLKRIDEHGLQWVGSGLQGK
jgi:hypothetical protein